MVEAGREYKLGITILDRFDLVLLAHCAEIWKGLSPSIYAALKVGVYLTAHFGVSN